MMTTTDSREASNCIRRRMAWAAWLLLVLAAGQFLFARGLSRRDEGRYAETSREMIIPGGNFWEMRLMGVRYYEKPPMIYWMSAASMKVLGVHGAAARVPLLLGMLATLGLCYHWARREWGRDAAVASTMVLFSCVGFILGMGILLTDPVLVMFMTAACLFLFEAYRPGGPRTGRWLLAAAGAAWGGVLTKGFIALVLPGAILFFWLLWERRLRDLWRWSLLPIGFLFVAALGTTLWQIEQHNPDFNFRFIVQEHFQRFAGTREIQGHEEPFWYYLPVVIALLAPWVLFLPRALRGMRIHRDLKTDSFSRFLVVWAAVIFLFFSASSGKLISYLMPLIPPMALLIARRGLLPGRSDADAVDRRLWTLGAILPLVAPLGLLVFWALAHWGLIAEDFGKPYGAVLAPLVLGLGIWAWVWMRGHWKTLAGLMLVMGAALVSLGTLFSPLAGPGFLVGLNDSTDFFLNVKRQVADTDELVVCNKHYPAMAFYTGRLPWMYRVSDELADGMKMEPGLPGIFTSATALNAQMSSDAGKKYYAVLLKEHRSALNIQGLRFDPEVLAEDRELVLLRLIAP